MNIEVLIDLTEADLELSPEEAESYCSRMVEEIQDDLVERAYLPRQSSSPKGALAGDAGFIENILKAEIRPTKIPALLGWLGERFYGRTKRIVYKDNNGNEIVLEYQTSKDLEQQQEVLKSIASFVTIRVLTTKN